jgi:beta-lactamase regulating signal transducer with metallopeptidase domain
MNAFATEELWRFALAAIPLAAIVAVLCRCLPCRPSTRHALWLTLLLLFALAPFLPKAPVPDLASLAGEEAGAVPAIPAVADEPSVTTGTMEKVATSSRAPLSGGGEAVAAEPAAGGSHDPGGPRPALVICPPLFVPTLTLPPGATGTESSASPRLAAADPRPDLADHRPIETESAKALAGTAEGALARAHPQNDVVDNPDDRLISGIATADTSAQSSAAIAAREQNRNRARTGDERSGSIAADDPSVWALWLTQLRTIRDAAMSLPPIPTSIWVGGAALIVLLTVARMVRFRRLLATATAAPPSAVRCVSEAASDLGLRGAPVTQMVAQRISPMVWCGRRPRLLLPETLWRQLDEAGRRAVIYHELAHLRRRDHLVCYLAMIVGCIYWWHPVVWWIRRQLREEADLCCDVWVTSLMPGARRAYATALLEARKYTSGFRPADPVAGLGVSTIRARRFARRLTMVMSHQLTPKLTFGGVLLACTLAAGSWLVTPTLACPPKDKQASKPCCGTDKLAEVPKAPKAPKASVFVVSSPAPPARPAPPAPPAAAAPAAPPAYQPAAALEKLPALHNPGDRSEMSLEERIRLLEKQLDVFIQHLKRWEQTADLEGLELPELSELSEISEQVMQNPQLQAVMKAGSKAATSAYEKAMTQYRSALGAMGDEHAQFLVTGPQKTEARTYSLPKGKLEAITKLMVRDDVPIYVSPGEDAITVHGTPMQHIIFDAFCKMINGEEKVKEYKLPEGKLKALSELMIRPDVPIMVSPGDKAIEVHGTDLEQEVFEAFVKMISPDEAKAAAGGTGIAVIPAPPQAPAVPKAPKAEAGVKSKSMEYEVRAAAQLQELKKLETTLKSLEKQAFAFEKKSEQLRQKAATLEEKSEALEEQAEEIEAGAFEAEGADRVRAIQRVNELMLEAIRLENEARLLEANADEIEARAEALDDQMERIEERIDQINELLESHDDDEDDDRY